MNIHHDVRGCMVVLALGIAISSGCSKDSSSQPAASQGNEATPTEGADKTGNLNDAQIAKILATVDSAEIEQAQLALTKAQQQPVKDFAQAMIDQHTTSKEQGAQLAQQAGITPAQGPISQNLEHKGKTMRDQLETQGSAGFDASYMKAQVEQHQEVLTMINSQLLPAASNASLRQQLTAAQSMVDHHLKQAQQIQSTLTPGAAP